MRLDGRDEWPLPLPPDGLRGPCRLPERHTRRQRRTCQATSPPRNEGECASAQAEVNMH